MQVAAAAEPAKLKKTIKKSVPFEMGCDRKIRIDKAVYVPVYKGVSMALKNICTSGMSG